LKANVEVKSRNRMKVITHNQKCSKRRDTKKIEKHTKDYKHLQHKEIRQQRR
jgi:hypothetical protein